MGPLAQSGYIDVQRSVDVVRMHQAIISMTCFSATDGSKLRC